MLWPRGSGFLPAGDSGGAGASTAGQGTPGSLPVPGGSYLGKQGWPVRLYACGASQVNRVLGNSIHKVISCAHFMHSLAMLEGDKHHVGIF